MVCRFLRSRSASSSPAGSSCEPMLPCGNTPSPPAVPGTAPPAPRPRGVPPIAIEAAIIAELFLGEAIRTPVCGSRLFILKNTPAVFDTASILVGPCHSMARTLNLDIQRRTASRRRSLRFTQRRRHVRQQDASRVFPSGSVLAPIRRLRPADAGTRSGQVKAIEIARILQRTLLAPAYTQFRRLSQPTRCRISENVFLFVSRRPPQGDDLRKNDTLCLALYPKPYSLRPTSFTLDTETAALGAPS